jgi:hypothetical protein
LTNKEEAVDALIKEMIGSSLFDCEKKIKEAE